MDHLKEITKREELGILYQEFYLTGTGAEIGVKKGKFSKQILNHWKGTLLCVDVWTDEDDYFDAKNLLPSQAVLIKDFSVEAAKRIKDESLDFVYIDADHRFESVMHDINAWFPKIRKGGIVSGHDYCRYLEHFGVIEAVNEFCSSNGYSDLRLTSNDYWNGIEFPSWYFKK